MVQMIKALMLVLAVQLQAKALQLQKRDERGEAVPWLIVLGAGIGIAYFAGDSVMAFAKQLVSNLGGN